VERVACCDSLWGFIFLARSDTVLRGWSDHWLIVELRDKMFFLAHVMISAMLGVFVGGLYFHTDLTIAIEGLPLRAFHCNSAASFCCDVPGGHIPRLCNAY